MDAHLTPSTSSNEGEAKGKLSKSRKYNEDYIKFGFIENSDGRPKCVLCLQILANEAMKPAKLKRHLITKHSEFMHKSKDYFQRRSEEYVRQKKRMVNLTSVSEKAQKASYLVAQRIAKCKKPHTIGQDLLLPAALDMCEVVLGAEASNKLKVIPLSNDTVKRRIQEMSADIEAQLLDRLRSCEQFSFQLDESTDISNAAQLIVLVRYPWEDDILEDFLFCKELPGRTTGEEVFRLMDAFMKEARLTWDRCTAVCTDGAASMTGRKSGLVARIKSVNPNIIATHCMLHRQALAAKDMDPDLHSVLNTAVSAVNFVKARALQSRLFGQLCRTWVLSMMRCCITPRSAGSLVGKFCKESLSYAKKWQSFSESKNPTLQFFTTQESVAKLAYLVDIFNALNGLNLSIQGAHASILEVSDKISAFMKKTDLWARRIQDGITDMFPQLSDFIHAENLSVDIVRAVITSHLTSLRQHFSSYFSDVNTEAWDWVRDPFAPGFANSLTGKAEEQLLEISCDRTLRARFLQVSPAHFWLSVSQDFSELTSKALEILLPFPTTYLCESSFSALTAMKNKYRARLHVEDDLRVCLSSIAPRIGRLCSQKQAHPSH